MIEPVFKPHYRTLERGAYCYKTLRSMSSAYAKKAREYVLSRDGANCCECGSEDSLQIDHIITVYRAFKDGIPAGKLNNVKNLRVLCSTCNASRSPQDEVN